MPNDLTKEFIERASNVINDDSIEKTLKSVADFDKDKLFNPKRKISTLQYPLDLDHEGDRNIIKFDINVPEGSRFEKDTGATTQKGVKPVVQKGGNSLRGKSKLSTKYKRTTDSIALYMPDEVSSVYTSDWQAKELGTVAGISKVLSNFDTLLSAEGAKTIFKAGAEGLSNSIAGALQQLTPIELQDARNFGKAQIVNPYLEVLFNGIENRPFNFQFKFTPRNGKESLEIKEIVNKFKYHHAPEFKYAENNLESYLMYPSTFDITFLHEGKQNNWIHKISTCALRSVNVDYNSEGGFRTFENGAPVVINMALEFIELEVLTKDRIKQGF